MKQSITKKTNRLQLLWLRPAIFIFKLLTKLPYRWQLGIGRMLGKISYWRSARLRHIAAINLKLCFPELDEQQREKLERKNFAAVGMGVMEMAMGWWMSDKRLKKRWHVTGLDAIFQAQAAGHGVILVSAHLTSMEICGRLMAMEMPLNVMYRPHKKVIIANLHAQYRHPHYARAIARDNVREMICALKNKEIVWHAHDVDLGEKGSVFLPFFGVQTASLMATSRIAKIANAKVLMVSFFRRDDNSGYDMKIHPALENFPSNNVVADTALINEKIEAIIKEKPEQYMWQYKRFKTRPEGEERFY